MKKQLIIFASVIALLLLTCPNDSQINADYELNTNNFGYAQGKMIDKNVEINDYYIFKTVYFKGKYKNLAILGLIL